MISFVEVFASTVVDGHLYLKLLAVIVILEVGHFITG